MALATGHTAKAAVKVFAPPHEGDRAIDVKRIEPSEERGATERAVREASVNLAPFVALEGAVGALQAGNIAQHTWRVEPRQRVEEAEDLHSAERVQQMWVVAEVAAEAAAVVLAREHKVDHLRKGIIQKRVGDSAQRVGQTAVR